MTLTITTPRGQPLAYIHTKNKTMKTKTYQIYCDRNDGNGPSLDGCWGSENASFTNRRKAESAARFLAKTYPDCDWTVEPCDEDGNPQ